LNYPLGEIEISLDLDTLEYSEFPCDLLSLTVTSVLVLDCSFEGERSVFFFNLYFLSFCGYFLDFYFLRSSAVTCSISSFKLIVLLLEVFDFLNSDLLFVNYY